MSKTSWLIVYVVCFVIGLAIGGLFSKAEASTLEHGTMERSVICGSLKDVHEILWGKHGERVALRGTSSTSFKEKPADVLFYVNQETSTYSVVVATKDIACVLEEGKLYMHAVKPGPKI